MKLVLFMVVCEGEYEVGWEALRSLVRSCDGHELSLLLLDDGSPSRVGRRLEQRLLSERSMPVDCIELEKSLGFRGSAIRAFKGLQHIAASGQSFDAVIKIDADALVLRKDLGALVEKTCAERSGLFGERYAMRWRDRLLYLADHVPAGFRRKVVDGKIDRDWRRARSGPVWWSDIGRRALRRGFRFEFIPGCFWFIGARTVQELAACDYLGRDQSSHGFVFNDDLLLTTAVAAIGHPIVDLAGLSSGWGGTMGMSEDAPLEVVLSCKPYVVHPLKNRPAAWRRREELRQYFPDLTDGEVAEPGGLVS